MRLEYWLVVVAASFLFPWKAAGEPVKAMHAIELDDAVGDVRNGEDPGKDVVKKFVPGETTPQNTHEVFWESPRADITGKEVTARVPYAELAASSGDTIRLAVREADSSFDERSFFPEISLTLK